MFISAMEDYITFIFSIGILNLEPNHLAPRWIRIQTKKYLINVQHTDPSNHFVEAAKKPHLSSRIQHRSLSIIRGLERLGFLAKGLWVVIRADTCPSSTGWNVALDELEVPFIHVCFLIDMEFSGALLLLRAVADWWTWFWGFIEA